MPSALWSSQVSVCPCVAWGAKRWRRGAKEGDQWSWRWHHPRCLLLQTYYHLTKHPVPFPFHPDVGYHKNTGCFYQINPLRGDWQKHVLSLKKMGKGGEKDESAWFLWLMCKNREKLLERKPLIIYIYIYFFFPTKEIKRRMLILFSINNKGELFDMETTT